LKLTDRLFEVQAELFSGGNIEIVWGSISVGGNTCLLSKNGLALTNYAPATAENKSTEMKGALSPSRSIARWLKVER
jgi:hypothetical protein